MHCVIVETFAVSKCSAATDAPFTFVMFREGELPEVPVLDPVQDVFVPDDSEFTCELPYSVHCAFSAATRPLR